MITVSRPITCPECQKDMDNYSIDIKQQRVTFRCKCGAVRAISFKEYQDVLRNKYQIK